VLVAVAAGTPALLYVLYVLHYSLNVPWSLDDWSVIGIVNAAVHGHLGMRVLWSQYGDRRLVVSRLLFAAFGVVDHLNEQSVILFSAGVYVVSFAFFLLIFRSYLGRKLTFLPVLVVSVVWFSVADYLNALWSFQLSWWLVLFFLIAVAYLLLLPRRHRNLCVGLAIAMAILGSFSDVQGFSVWPVGLVCLLWTRPWGRRTYLELGTWVVATLVTAAVYFRSYNFSNAQCFFRSQCSLSYELGHPILLAKGFVLLVGYVLPTGGSWISGPLIGAHELLGAAISIAAGYVVVKSIRERRLKVNPLPSLLIIFGVLFDMLITESRIGDGITQLTSDQYVMPNLLILLGIVSYACAHGPGLRTTLGLNDGRRWFRILGAGTFAAFVMAQCVLGTDYGIAAAIVRRQDIQVDARVLTNQHRIPSTEWPCYTADAVFLWTTPAAVAFFWDSEIVVAKQDRLSLFQSRAELHLYRAEGPPRVYQCQRR
jgi:hypothetical protein